MSFGLNSVSANAVLDLRQVLIQLGVISANDLDALDLTDAHLLAPDQAHLPIEEQRISENYLLQLWSIADQHTALPDIGVLIGKHYRAETRGVLANWLFQCNNLLQSLDVFIKHTPLMNPSERWWYRDITENKTRIYIEFRKDKQYPRAAIERSMATLLVWCQELTGIPTPILEVTFSGEKPTYSEALSNTFDANIKYDSEYNSILLPNSYLSRKILSSNPYLKTIMADKANAMLANLQHDTDLIETIKAIICQDFAAIPDINALSRQLNLSRATLYRQLKNLDTTYSDIVTDSQKNQAAAWLKEGRPLNAISIDLGFSDSSAFYKAFKRWHGLTPAQFKDQHNIQ